jgi:flotillin
MQVQDLAVIVGAVIAVVLFIPLIVSKFLRDVDSGSIRLVSWLQGSTVIYRGPGKSKEIPLLTTGTTIPSAAINVDLDITDQTADVDANGVPCPIKVRVLASAIVSVGDTDEMIKTAANRFFAKEQKEQTNTLTDLLTSAGRRAVNLLTHDQLFSAKTTTRASSPAAPSQEEDDDPLAIIIRKACSRELTDLGLGFSSLNIKVVQSDVAEARRRQSAAEANANAEIVAAQQTRRAQEAQLEAQRVISDKQRELAQTQAENAARVAEAEAKKQEALATLRVAELKATQIAQASADAERQKIAAAAAAEAEAVKIRTVATAQAEAIQKVNDAIQQGGDAYLKLRQLEMLPTLAPAIADALSEAKLVTISGGGGADGGAAGSATSNIMSVIQTMLAADLLRGGLTGANGSSRTE